MVSAHQDYDAIPAVNWSSLKHIAVSPLLYKWRLEHREERKPAFVLGSAIHCAILEPETFDARYAVYEGVRNGGKWEEWQASHPGVETLKPDEMRRVRIVADRVFKDDVGRHARELLRGGRAEEVLTWTDEATGVACKGRLDYIRPDLIIDVKSTSDPEPSKFERSSATYCYDAQIALYHDGAIAKRLIDGRKRPYVIAPQTDEPYDVAVFQLKPETLEMGRAFYRSLLHKLVQCTEANYWPGVTPEVRQLGIPPWVESQRFNLSNGEEF